MLHEQRVLPAQGQAPTVREVMRAWLHQHGIIGYTDRILSTLAVIEGAAEPPEAST